VYWFTAVILIPEIERGLIYALDCRFDKSLSGEIGSSVGEISLGIGHGDTESMSMNKWRRGGGTGGRFLKFATTAQRDCRMTLPPRAP
jgi:hypothetical protein